MVATVAEYNFISVIDGFFALKKFSGPHSTALKAAVRARAVELFSHPDIRYMPAFKILDLLAAFVNIASTIAEASQLRANEARLLLRESLADSTPLIRQFMLDAALERVRYEPMMLAATPPSPEAARLAVLQRRWAAMRATHQEATKLPDAWLEIVDSAVDTSLAAPEFSQFRQGPLLQFFSEMLALARKLHKQGASLQQLAVSLKPGAALWKRYALKSARYNEKPAMQPAAIPFPEIPPSRWVH